MSDPVSATPVESRTVALAHEELGEVVVMIRRNPRARHVRLHVDEGGTVRASVPKRFAASRLDDIVRERADWLVQVLTRMQLADKSTEVDLVRGDPIRLLGRWHATELRLGARATVVLDDDRVV